MGTDTAIQGDSRLDLNTAQIKAWYAEGATLSEIGERLGISPSAVHRHMMAADIPRRKPGRKPGDRRPRPRHAFKPTRHHLDMDQIRAWYEEGASIGEIGRRLGVPKKTVHRHMIAAEIPRRLPGPVTAGGYTPLSDEEKAAIRAAAEAGTAITRIAAAFGRSDDTVRRLIPKPERADGRKHPDREAKVREMHAQGLRGRQIDDALGWTRGGAAPIQRRLGLETRSPLPDACRVAEAYRTLGSEKAAAAHLHKDIKLIRSILRDAGIIPAHRVYPMPGSRAQRILDVLAGHPEGLPTPQIAELSGEHSRPRQQALTRCGNELRRLEQRGRVRRIGFVPGGWQQGREAIWAAVPDLRTGDPAA
jgi:DNA-binding NarL/FixJ family response regulator